MAGSKDDCLKVGLLLGTETIPEWFVRAIETAAGSDNVEISLILRVERRDASDDVSLLTDVRRKKSWTIVAGLQKISDAVFGSPWYGTPRDVETIPCLEGVPERETTAEPTGKYGCALSADAVEAIRSEVDVAVHFGVGILRGEILEAPTLGVIGFHHGDLRFYRGGPPGFWEFVHGRSTTGVTVQRFTETLDGGEILAFESVAIDDAESWREVRCRQCRSSEPLLATALQNLRDPEFSPGTPDELGPVYSPSQRDWRTTARYLLRELAGRTRSSLGR